MYFETQQAWLGAFPQSQHSRGLRAAWSKCQVLPQKRQKELATVAHDCNPSTARGSKQYNIILRSTVSLRQPGLQKTLSQIQNKTEPKTEWNLLFLH